MVAEGVEHWFMVWTPESRSPLELATSVGVAPDCWVAEHHLGRSLSELAWWRCDGLWHERDPSPWLPSGGGDPRRAWGLWAALRALAADFTEASQSAPWVQVVVGRPGHALATINGTSVAFRRMDAADHLLRLGRFGSNVVVPGPTLEEVIACRYGVTLDPAGGEAGAGELDDSELDADRAAVRRWSSPRMAATLAGLIEADWSDLVAEEHARAQRWLAADRSLGLVCLLGALPEHLHRSVARRRAAGYVDNLGAMTTAGWWRLCYLSGCGRGWTERRRARLLRGCRDQVVGGSGRRVRRPGTPRFAPKHLTLVQRRVLEHMEAGQVPLGVEYSLLGALVHQMTQRRPDALLVAPDGHVVWLEVMRRPISRRSHAEREWQHLRRAIGLVSARTRRRVELMLYEPKGVVTRWEYEHRRVAPD